MTNAYKLFILRHGIAAERGGFTHDSERTLTSEGEEEMERVAKGMQKLGLEFDLILSSPYVRARQTAEIVADRFKMKVKFTDNLIPSAEAKKLLREIEADYGSARNILLASHDPFVSAFMSIMVAGSPAMVVDFKKGGLCKVVCHKLTMGMGQLKWLLTPRQLALMA